MAMKFKVGDKVYIFKPKSTWTDTDYGIRNGDIKLKTMYVIREVFTDMSYGPSAYLQIGSYPSDTWGVGIDCLKHWNKFTTKPPWL